MSFQGPQGVFSQHFAAFLAVFWVKKFAVVPPESSNNLLDSGKHAFSVIGGGWEPQWLNMGGGLGEGGEIRESGEADLITISVVWGPKWSRFFGSFLRGV